MIDAILYEAGRYKRAFRYSLTMELWRQRPNRLRSSMICRFVEMWCHANCRGCWRVRETEQTISISFELTRDIVLFKISDEYEPFSGMEIVNNPIKVAG